MNGGRERRTRRLGVLGVIALALVTGAALTWGPSMRMWRGGEARASSPSSFIRTGRAVVERTDVASRQTTIGTLGYAGRYTVVSELAGEVLTRLPAPGTDIVRGQPLYEVDGASVRLLYGARPAWRDFRLGMTDGSDVTELERNLVALGLDPGHDLTVDRHFTWATTEAIDRWQRSIGLPETGCLLLGQVTFLPGPIRVTGDAVSPGAPLIPGATVLTATSTTPVVTVALDVASEGVIRPGDRVLVTLPGGSATSTGTVSWVSPVAAGPTDQGSSGQQPTSPVIPVSIRLNRPREAAGFDQAPVQVIFTQQEHRGVLAVPITALLARAQGYAVEVVQGSARRLIPVTTGLFDDASGIVEVTGPRLTAGMRVEVAGG